ncbi:helix-turn-helix transcriptional regulator [Sinomonas sp. R1AF57]|uniref:ArsR/SmtB family transcription factor n=1 Tax=Sinomonas sp. R1AF57 TaxID=2020377 RepID=UPI000B61CBF8|nr:metalloregulator ArsR/SmtB family transcription factor [Sinomonas sp. R1AF57]ASN52900.1 transcriptional regulator [Sinomonas sp. R1AF57]
MVTDIFAVIADRTRRDILETLRSGDKAVGELVEALAASQPTVSKHLKVLRDAGLVTTRAQGQKRYYTLRLEPLDDVGAWLAGLRTTPESPAPDASSSAAAAGDGARGRDLAFAGGVALADATVADAAFAAADGRQADDGLVAEDTPASPTGRPEPAAEVPGAPLAGTEPVEATTTTGDELVLVPAAVVPAPVQKPSAAGDHSRPAQIQRTVERTVERAAARATEIMANLPKFGRRSK